MKNVTKNHAFYLFASLLPLIIAGCGGGQHQEKIKKLFPNTLSPINPGQKTSFFLFVQQRDYERNFTVSPIRVNQENILFDVQLPNLMNQKTLRDEHLEPEQIFEQIKNGVTLRVKLLQTKAECIHFFGKNGKNFLRGKKIYPIHLTLENNSSSKTFLPFSQIDLKLASQKSVLKKMRNRRETLKNIFRITGIVALGALATAGVICIAGIGLLIYSGPLIPVTCLPGPGF